MTKKPLTFIAFFAPILALILGAAAAPDQSDGKVKDLPAAEIRQVLQDQQAAWNRGDIDRFMSGYWRSPETVFVSGDVVTHGWETVRDRYRSKYSDREKMGTLNFSDLVITPLSGDSAMALGRWALKRASDTPHGCFTLIFRKTADGWRIVHDHTSAASP